jgi:pyridoxal phosphate enzyme (YggS family)
MQPAVTIAARLRAVQDRLAQACARVQRDPREVRLVAVSKTKPSALIRECFEAGQLEFGENYVQELTEKAPTLPASIRWHFIGRVQNSRKARDLVAIPNLAMVETIHSDQAAADLNRHLTTAPRQCQFPLPVLVQVNTSAEVSKSGVAPDQCLPLVDFILTSCPALHFAGLMTIGSPVPLPDHNDFARLAALREDIYRTFSSLPRSLELSMGMSHDFEEAIRYGSTCIRVGSAIFGERAINS